MLDFPVNINRGCRTVNFNSGCKAVIMDGEHTMVMKVTGTEIDMTGPFDNPEIKLYGYLIEPSAQDGHSRIKIEASHIELCVNGKGNPVPPMMRKKKVIYHPPATVVLWEDGTKTVVKCDERDKYDPKYGLALCYMKKALGNSSRALNDVLHSEGEWHDYD